ncbi:reverse transcriptase domain-containing protein [Tanacetum coccineum]
MIVDQSLRVWKESCPPRHSAYGRLGERWGVWEERDDGSEGRVGGGIRGYCILLDTSIFSGLLVRVGQVGCGAKGGDVSRVSGWCEGTGAGAGLVMIGGRLYNCLAIDAVACLGGGSHRMGGSGEFDVGGDSQRLGGGWGRVGEGGFCELMRASKVNKILLDDVIRFMLSDPWSVLIPGLSELPPRTVGGTGVVSVCVVSRRLTRITIGRECVVSVDLRCTGDLCKECCASGWMSGTTTYGCGRGPSTYARVVDAWRWLFVDGVLLGWLFVCIRTRSQSQISNRQQQQVPPNFVEPFNLVETIENQPPPVVTMVDNRTMAQLLDVPTEGYEDSIIVPEITADNFELKHDHFYDEVPERPEFQQRFDETFYEAWDRFNDLLRACPHHGFSELHQLDTFYNALNSNDQDSLNSAAGGNFLDKMPRDCLRIIESKSKVRNSRNKPVVAKVSSSSSTPGISPDVAELKDMVKALLLDKKNQSQAPAPVKAVEESCVTCGGAHSYRNCPATDGNVYRDNIQEYVSQAAAVNYNQGNTSYRAPIANQIRPPGFPPVQQNQGNNQNRYNQNRGNNYNQGQIYRPPINQPPVHQAPPYQAPAPQTQGVSKDDFQNYVKANDAVMRNMQNQNQNLQNQMTNLTDMLSKFMNSNTASTSGSRTLPSNTITNPKVDLKGITTRSGVAYQGPTIPTTSSSPPKVVERETEPVSAPLPNPKPSIPYPSKRNDERHREKANDQIKKFYEIFKDLSFEISLTDALILMPKFASTLKALIGNKEKLSEMARTPLNEHCSAVILNKLPEKLGDPGKFLIPCDFPGMDECLALADLGASINLMPLSVWKRLSLPELTPTCMTLELADRSITQPIGIAEDVYVKVGKFHFPADFVVVDFDADPRVPLILGRSFLKTGRALIDVYKGELTLRVGKEAVTFNLDQTSRYSSNYDDMTANRIDVIEMACEDDFLLLEEADAFLALEDDPTSPEVDDSYYDSEGDILLLEAILNSDPSPPPPNQGNYLLEIRKELKVCEAKTDKSSIGRPPDGRTQGTYLLSLNTHFWRVIHVAVHN